MYYAMHVMITKIQQLEENERLQSPCKELDGHAKKDNERSLRMESSYGVNWLR